MFHCPCEFQIQPVGDGGCTKGTLREQKEEGAPHRFSSLSFAIQGEEVGQHFSMWLWAVENRKAAILGWLWQCLNTNQGCLWKDVF